MNITFERFRKLKALKLDNLKRHKFRPNIVEKIKLFVKDKSN